MYTKKYLKESGYKFRGMFGYTSEIWTRRNVLVLIDVNTRQLLTRYSKGS